MRFYTAGESHGKCVLAFVEGIPAGLDIDINFINRELRRRQKGYGRGGRMKIEQDEAEILSGVLGGKSIGSPIAILIKNRDWENWKDFWSFPSEERKVFVPRPGHADLPGCLKFNLKDARPILERASARETAARVAAGAVFKLFLRTFGIEIASAVLRIGKAQVKTNIDFESMRKAESSDLRCPDPETEKRMREEIDKAKENGDTVGGIFEVRAKNVPPGLGSHTQWDKRLDALIAMAMMSIQGVKAVAIGCGWECFNLSGSEFHDEILWENGFKRDSNNAGGIEGGISNGEEIIVKCFMKPIPTLMRPLRSVDLRTKEPKAAQKERSDVCAVPAAAVVGEAMLSFVLSKALKEKIGGDSIDEMRRNFEAFLRQISSF